MILEVHKRKTRGGKRVGLCDKGMKTRLVLGQKKHAVRSQLCQLLSKLDYALIKTNFSNQVRLTCHFIIFPIRITTEDKVTSAVIGCYLSCTFSPCLHSQQLPDRNGLTKTELTRHFQSESESNSVETTCRGTCNSFSY